MSATRASLWSRIKYTLLSPEAAALRRKRLAQEVARSPVSDIREILKVNGKFFPAPTGPTPIREAVSVPELRGPAIAGNELSLPQFFMGKVSLLTVGFSAYSEPHIESFRRPFLDSHVREGRCEAVELRPLMTRLKWLFYSRLMRHMSRDMVPKELQHAFMVVYRPMALLEALQVPNHLGGYVYLVDRAGRVRWRASGQAEPLELETMHRVTRALLAESATRHGPRSG